MQHVDQQVQCLQRAVEGFGIERRAAVAGGVEAILDRMADRHHVGEVEETRAALDGVEAAEYRIEAFAIGRRALQRDHLLAELVEDLARFDQEVGADVGGERGHAYRPSADSSALASSWVAGFGSRPATAGPVP